jgi:hypothetical protein
VPTITNQSTIYAERHWKGGEYFAWTGNPTDDWVKEGLSPTDKVFTIEIGEDAPNGAIITCQTPITTTGRVRGYPSIRHGTYENGVTEVTIKPRRIRDLSKMEYAFSLDYRSLIGGDANILFDSFLLTDPKSSKSKAFELGVIPLPASDTRHHAQKNGKDMGTFYDRHGRGWLMSLFQKADGGLYLMPLPADGSFLAGEVDQLEMYRWAVGRGIITGDLWYTGTALGLEPIGGTTQMRIDNWSPIVA